MFNYIRAEFYKLFHRKYIYIVLGIMLVLEGLLLSTFVIANHLPDHVALSYFSDAITTIPLMGPVGFIMCTLAGDVVFAEQLKHSTLKNEVAFGLSRSRIYLGKLLSQTLLSLFCLVVMMAFYIGAAAIFLPHNVPADRFTDAEALQTVGSFLAAAIPLWLGAQALYCMLQFTFHSTAGSIIYACLIFVLPGGLRLLGALVSSLSAPLGKFLVDMSLWLPSEVLQNGGMAECCLVGAFWIVLPTALGLFGFSRKEIK